MTNDEDLKVAGLEAERQKRQLDQAAVTYQALTVREWQTVLKVVSCLQAVFKSDEGQAWAKAFQLRSYRKVLDGLAFLAWLADHQILGLRYKKKLAKPTKERVH